ncbi:hypothetical protein AB4142_29175, partial [Variovorax sp. 2RAF20]
MGLIGGAGATVAQAAIVEAPGNTRQRCDTYDVTLQVQIHGCFVSTASIVDLTSGATVGDGKPVLPGDILQFTYTLTN